MRSFILNSLSIRHLSEFVKGQGFQTTLKDVFESRRNDIQSRCHTGDIGMKAINHFGAELNNGEAVAFYNAYCHASLWDLVAGSPTTRNPDLDTGNCGCLEDDCPNCRPALNQIASGVPKYVEKIKWIKKNNLTLIQGLMLGAIFTSLTEVEATELHGEYYRALLTNRRFKKFHNETTETLEDCIFNRGYARINTDNAFKREIRGMFKLFMLLFRFPIDNFGVEKIKLMTETLKTNKQLFATIDALESIAISGKKVYFATSKPIMAHHITFNELKPEHYLRLRAGRISEEHNATCTTNIFGSPNPGTYFMSDVEVGNIVKQSGMLKTEPARTTEVNPCRFSMGNPDDIDGSKLPKFVKLYIEAKTKKAKSFQSVRN